MNAAQTVCNGLPRVPEALATSDAPPERGRALRAFFLGGPSASGAYLFLFCRRTYCVTDMQNCRKQNEVGNACAS